MMHQIAYIPVEAQTHGERMDAIIDAFQKIPHLAIAIDPEQMRVQFNRYFQREYPHRRLTPTQCQIHRLYYKPRKGCQITYLLTGYDEGTGSIFHQWFVGKLSAGGRDSLLRVKPALEVKSDSGGWKPLSVWHELNMLLYAFPNDPKIPHLGKLIEPTFIKEQIRANLRGLGLEGDWDCRHLSWDYIKYMPGKRCTLKYDVDLENRHHENRHFTIYNKTYQNFHSRYVYRVLKSIRNTSSFFEGKLMIPEPVAHIDPIHSFWQLGWQGEALGQAMQKSAASLISEPALMQNVAKWLASLHQTKLVGIALHQSPGVNAGFQHSKEDVVHILEFLPERSSFLTREIERLGLLLEKLPLRGRQTTIHGTFKIAQVLYHGDNIAVIDFDSAGVGNPHLDVAEFLASLAYLLISHDVAAQKLIFAMETFLNTYQENIPWKLNFCNIAAYFAIFLLGKIHSSLKRLESTAIQHLPLAFEWLHHDLTLGRYTHRNFMTIFKDY